VSDDEDNDNILSTILHNRSNSTKISNIDVTKNQPQSEESINSQVNYSIHGEQLLANPTEQLKQDMVSLPVPQLLAPSFTNVSTVSQIKDSAISTLIEPIPQVKSFSFTLPALKSNLKPIPKSLFLKIPLKAAPVTSITTMTAPKINNFTAIKIADGEKRQKIQEPSRWNTNMYDDILTDQSITMESTVHEKYAVKITQMQKQLEDLQQSAIDSEEKLRDLTISEYYLNAQLLLLNDPILQDTIYE